MVKSFIHVIFDRIPNANGGHVPVGSQGNICCILLFLDSKRTEKQLF
jgi:hypothetical protein